MKKPDKIEQIAVDDLLPYAKNSRTHSPEQVAQIAASMVEFGWTNPVLIDANGMIVAGHGRVLAARKLNMDSVPCIRLGHLTPTQARAYVIADNKLALNAGWDDAMLKAELDVLKEEGFEIGLTGFSDDEIEALLDVEVVEGNTDPDDVPEAPVDPITKPGDLWILGNHRLMCGDSTSLQDVERLMDSMKSELVFTDPPYGVSFRSNRSKRFDVLQNDDKILDVAPIVWAIMGEDTAAFIWTSHDVYPQWRNQFDSFYKQTIVWYKGWGGMGDLSGQYALDYELALFCTKGNPKFRNGRGMAVWDVSKDAASKYVHPTQKPVALGLRAIGDFSDQGDVVLDLFGGSGTTAIACEKTGRKARLMELDPKYCDVIVKRWEEFTGRKAERK